MDRNPREVLMIVIEDAAPTADIKRELEDGGPGGARQRRADRARASRSPTLRALVDSGRRLLVMAEDKGDATGWYRRAFDVLQETPFAFTSTAQLERPDVLPAEPRRHAPAALPHEPLGRELPAAPARRERRQRARRSSCSARASARGSATARRRSSRWTSSSAAISSARSTSSTVSRRMRGERRPAPRRPPDSALPTPTMRGRSARRRRRLEEPSSDPGSVRLH